MINNNSNNNLNNKNNKQYFLTAYRDNKSILAMMTILFMCIGNCKQQKIKGWQEKSQSNILPSATYVVNNENKKWAACHVQYKNSWNFALHLPRLLFSISVLDWYKFFRWNHNASLQRTIFKTYTTKPLSLSPTRSLLLILPFDPHFLPQSLIIAYKHSNSLANQPYWLGTPFHWNGLDVCCCIGERGLCSIVPWRIGTLLI